MNATPPDSQSTRCNELWVAPRWVEQSQAAGWTSFAEVWRQAERGVMVRDLRPHRFTARLPATADRPAVYIKCHNVAPWRECWKAWLRGRRLQWGARGEWQSIWALQQLEIPTPEPVLYGEQGGRSLIVTVALDECEELPRLIARNEITPERLQELMTHIVWIARRLHGAGWQHQDFYLDHFLSPLCGNGCPFLIDLHRSRRAHPLPLSWRVKDLAQLHFSARALRSTEQLRWFLRYCDQSRLDQRARELLRRVLSKSAAIAGHALKNGVVLDLAVTKRRAG